MGGPERAEPEAVPAAVGAHAPEGRSPEELRDVTTLREYLADEAVLAAHLLGDLDPRYFELTRWFVVRGPSGALRGLLMRYDGYSLPTVCAYGDAEAVAQVLAHFRRRLPERFELQAFAPHLPALREHFPTVEFRLFLRMGITRQDFVWPQDDKQVRRLSHEDTADLVRLYARTGITFFDPYQLETGFYFGVRKDGRIVSAAGVHIVSEENAIAVVGNVATHPDYRGQGLSHQCMGRLVRELLKRVRVIVLNVEATNRTATRLYRELGFREFSEMHVGVVGVEAPSGPPFRRV